MAQQKIHAVLFDIGETLLNFGRVDITFLFKEGGKLAYDFLKNSTQPTGPFNPFISRHLWTIRRYHLWSMISRRDFDSLELLKKIEQKRGVNLSQSQWEEFGWCWYEPLSKLAKIEPDTKETLIKLKQEGLKLGVLSNTFINAVTLEKHMAQLGILEFFDAKLYSYQFKFRKPDKRIFIEAAKKLNCPPENVLFVGDRLDIDIVGALRANMTAAMKKAYTNILRKLPINLIKIDELAELPEIIRQINAAN